MKHFIKVLTAGFATFALAGAASAQQGVTDTSIKLGSHTPLSGPLSPWGTGSTGAAKAYFAEVNAQGGIFGRTIEFVVEDSGYQVPKATEAGRKLIVDEGIFAMLLALGTPHNNAVLPLQGEFGVTNVMPMTAARSMAQVGDGTLPDSFQALSSYHDQAAAGVTHFMSQGASTPCAIYLDTDFGVEILKGATKGAGGKLAATAAHQPGDKNFVGTLTRLAGAGCDVVALGVNFPEAIAIKATAARIGLDIPMIGSTAIFEEAVILQGAQVGILAELDGLYAAGAWMSMNDAKNSELNPRAAEAAQFEEQFKAATGAPIVTGAAMLGRVAAEVITAALVAAGPDLTTESLVSGLEKIELTSVFTGDPIKFGPGGRVGSEDIYLSVVKNSQWSFVQKL